MMQKIRKTGNSYVVTISKREFDRLKLKEGQLVDVQIQPLNVRPALSPELREAFEASWRENEEAYRYLAER